MIVGIFVMIPGLQMICAALIALPFRANIPVAAAVTWTSNPLTTPFILVGAVFVGNDVFGLEANPAQFFQLVERGASVREWLTWLASDAAPALVGGLLIIALVAGAASYLLADWFWRYRVSRRWKRRNLNETMEQQD
jgi:uncharacterized protein (DUF2062 family)